MDFQDLSDLTFCAAEKVELNSVENIRDGKLESFIRSSGMFGQQPM